MNVWIAGVIPNKHGTPRKWWKTPFRGEQIKLWCRVTTVYHFVCCYPAWLITFRLPTWRVSKNLLFSIFPGKEEYSNGGKSKDSKKRRGSSWKHYPLMRSISSFAPLIKRPTCDSKLSYSQELLLSTTRVVFRRPEIQSARTDVKVNDQRWPVFTSGNRPSTLS